MAIPLIDLSNTQHHFAGSGAGTYADPFAFSTRDMAQADSAIPFIDLSNRVRYLKGSGAGTPGDPYILGINFLDSSTVSVLSYGAKGDGVTNDTAAVQAALDASITLGKKLFFPAGTYKIATSLSNTTGGNIDLEFDVGAVLDCSTSTASTAITLGGSLGAGVALSSNANKGDSSISATGHGLVAGDIVQIVSTDLRNSTRVDYYKGEIAKVASVSGSTINFDTPLYDGYTAATTSVYKCTAATVRIRGITIRHNGPYCGLLVRHAKNILIENPTVEGAKECGIRVRECFNATIVNGSTLGAYYVGTNTAYGLSIYSSQHVKVIGGYWHGGRHGITTGGTFPERDIKLIGCTVTNDNTSGVYGFDSHGNTEFIELIGCHSLNGAAMQANNIKVIGGEYRTIYAKFALAFLPEISGSHIIVDSVLCDNPTHTCALTVTFWQNNLTFDLISFRDVRATGGTNLTSTNPGVIYINANTNGWSETVSRFSINGCTATIAGAPASTAYLLDIGNAITLTTALNIINSDFTSTYDKVRPLRLAITGATKSVSNTCSGKSVSDYGCVVSAGDFFSMLDLYDGQTSALYNNLSTTGKVRFIDCIMANFGSNGGLNIGSATDVRIKGTEKVNSTGNFNVAATYPYSDYTAAGNKILYRSAVPSAYAWLVGDICINSAPAVGSPKAWRCTAAGTPGTWTSEGNL